MDLSALKALFPNVCILALTATASPKDVKGLQKNLCLENVKVLRISPNRQNVFISTAKRGSNNIGLLGYDKILYPIANALNKQREIYPMTIIYMNLQYCGYAYQLFSKIIKGLYVGGDVKGPKSCLFAQFHLSLYKDLKDDILDEIKNNDSRIRVIFATTALGMGVDAANIRIVIHIRPPNSVESYIQEIGRAGRDGKPSTAFLYFNNSDLSSKNISESMVKFCRESGCLRKFVLKYFGFSFMSQEKCCSNCNKYLAVGTIQETQTNKTREVVRVVNSIDDLSCSVQKLLDDWSANASNLYEFQIKEDLGTIIARESVFIATNKDLFEMFDWIEEYEELCNDVMTVIENFSLEMKHIS